MEYIRTYIERFMLDRLFILDFNKIPIFHHKSAKIIEKLLEICYTKNVLVSIFEREECIMDSNVERWYSMEEICEHLGVSRDTVLIWIKKRDMPASKMGRLWKFKVSEVDEWTKSGKAAENDFFLYNGYQYCYNFDGRR